MTYPTEIRTQRELDAELIGGLDDDLDEDGGWVCHCGDICTCDWKEDQ